MLIQEARRLLLPSTSIERRIKEKFNIEDIDFLCKHMSSDGQNFNQSFFYEKSNLYSKSLCINIIDFLVNLKSFFEDDNNDCKYLLEKQDEFFLAYNLKIENLRRKEIRKKRIKWIGGNIILFSILICIHLKFTSIFGDNMHDLGILLFGIIIIFYNGYYVEIGDIVITRVDKDHDTLNDYFKNTQVRKIQKILEKKDQIILILNTRINKIKYLEKKNQAKENIEDIREMNPYDFEHLVANMFRYYGFQALPTKKSGDHGVDIFLIKGKKHFAVQCKRQVGGVGTPKIREFIGSMQYAKVSSGFFVTTGEYSLEVVKMFKNTNFNIVLIDIHILDSLLDHKRENGNIEKFNQIIAEGYENIKEYTSISKDKQNEYKRIMKKIRRNRRYK